MPITATLTLSHLESHLREAAYILRGNPVDRTDWKSYILPLLFFKRICDLRSGLRDRDMLLYVHSINIYPKIAPAAIPGSEESAPKGYAASSIIFGRCSGIIDTCF
jgi:hypothetical protein